MVIRFSLKTMRNQCFQLTMFQYSCNVILKWKPRNIRVSDFFVHFVISCFSVGLPNVTEKKHINRLRFFPLKVATDQFVVFLVVGEFLSAKFSAAPVPINSGNGPVVLRFLCSCCLNCLREGRKPKKNLAGFPFPSIIFRNFNSRTASETRQKFCIWNETALVILSTVVHA